MAATPMSPGTMLDGRYRLDVLLSEHGGARFWRATDTVLERSVAVHVVPSDDPRSPKVLAAARSSAAVSDPRLLRVLDCDDADGLTWVINEWGDGVSLDVMLARGTLPPMRAAWLTREVAQAIVAAHAQGLCHGRLNPEAVLVTESGAVKLIGFVVNAAFERTPPPAKFYGDISPREVDVVDLAGLLYAALTGKWPGVSHSAVPAAPREGHKPLRPRQVRAGVPRDLDAICDRVLNKEASQHTMPIETALEIAAALSDYVGDPALVAPVDAPSMHDEPAPPAGADEPEAADESVTPDEPTPDEPAVDEPEAAEVTADHVPVVVPEEPAAEAPGTEPAETEDGGSEQPAPRPAARPAGTTPTPPAAPAAPPAPKPTEPDPEDTMATPPPFSPSGIEYFEPEDWEPITPLPPFEQPPERPLFADEDRRVPAAARVPLAATPPAGTGVWEPEAPRPEPSYEAPRRRRGLQALLIVAVVLGVAAAMYLAFNAGKDDADQNPGSTPTTGTSTTPVPRPSATPDVSGTVVPVKAVGDFDPEGDPQEESPGRARLAVDGKATTVWPTSRYPDANFGSQVSGVGLVLDLGAVKSVSSVQVQLVGAPTDVRFYASPADAGTPPAELADAEEIGRVTGSESFATVEFDATRTRYLIVWLTKLPADGTTFRGQIAEITVRS